VGPLGVGKGMLGSTIVVGFANEDKLLGSPGRGIIDSKEDGYQQLKKV